MISRIFTQPTKEIHPTPPRFFFHSEMSTSVRPMHGGCRMPAPSRSACETSSQSAPTIVRLRLNPRPGAFVPLEFGPAAGGVGRRVVAWRGVHAVRESEVGCSGGGGGEREGGGVDAGEVNRWGLEKGKAEVAVAAAATVVLGVGNRVLNKLALVPLKQYPFFLAQVATVGYIVVYFSILYVRYHAGIVTDEMLSMPKAPYIATGLLEALAAATGMAAGAILSGASIPILSQTFLIWQILLSVIFLGRRYRVNQLIGCFLVAVGVVITVWSGSGAGHSLRGAGLFWSLMMIASFLLQAAVTVLKEVIFLDFSRKKGGSVDLFVVNSYGSAFQALFISLMLPFLSKMWGVPFSQLPTYIRDGTACFLNIGSLSSGCEGAPLLPLLFIAVNMGFNIALLHLLKISSAVVSCLASTFSVPISVYIFTLPLPYLGVASSLPPGFVAGAIVLLIGLLVYAYCPSSGSSKPQLSSGG